MTYFGGKISFVSSISDDDVDSETRLDTGDKKIGADRRVEGGRG